MPDRANKTNWRRTTDENITRLCEYGCRKTNNEYGNSETSIMRLIESTEIIQPSGNVSEPRFEYSRSGNLVIQVGKYRFRRMAPTQGPKAHWVCNRSNNGCRAKILTVDNIIMKHHNIHSNHPWAGSRREHVLKQRIQGNKVVIYDRCLLLSISSILYNS